MNRNTERIQQNLDEMRQIQQPVLVEFSDLLMSSVLANKRYTELTNEIKQISLTVHQGLKSIFTAVYSAYPSLFFIIILFFPWIPCPL